MEPILKKTTGYKLDKLPKGLDTVLTLQTTGFWGRLDQRPAKPNFSENDGPKLIYTFDPWVGCVYGTNGRQSYWYEQWGSWLLYKPDITSRLRKQLLDKAGKTRMPYKGAAIYMSPKTDPLVPIANALAITAQNLDVFLDADCFLMIQTRSPKVEEDKGPNIFNRIVELASRKKVGVSFSISTDNPLTPRSCRRHPIT